MPRNVEIKARVESIESLQSTVAKIADGAPTEIIQDDTFFACDQGRLKLRSFPNGEGVLIAYQRHDQAGPRESSFVTCPTSAPDALREVLSRAYPQAGRVEKHRTLFLVGRTRVHLDRVKNLGCFVELEVVLHDGELLESGIQEAERLMAMLGISESQLIEAAYVDLLMQKGA